MNGSGVDTLSPSGGGVSFFMSALSRCQTVAGGRAVGVTPFRAVTWRGVGAWLAPFEPVQAAQLLPGLRELGPLGVGCSAFGGVHLIKRPPGCARID